MATAPAPLLSFREVLRLTSFRRLWLGQIVSLFGDFLAIFAVLIVATVLAHEVFGKMMDVLEVRRLGVLRVEHLDDAMAVECFLHAAREVTD